MEADAMAAVGRALLPDFRIGGIAGRDFVGRVVILRFTAVRGRFSSLRCPYNRHSGLRRNPGS